MKQHEMLLEMFVMQDNLNKKLASNWINRNDWSHREALVVEVAEVLTELNYKWWKAPTVINWYKVRMELVDCWHFIINLAIQERLFDYYSVELREAIEASHVITPTCRQGKAGELKKQITRVTTSATESMLEPFLAACLCADMSFEQLYSLYVTKNTLNMFRWDNGYKEGTYKWTTEEDQIYVNGIVTKLEQDVLYSAKACDIYDTLAKLYEE